MRILVEPKNALPKTVPAASELDNGWKFSPPLLENRPAGHRPFRIGARGLRAIMEKIMTKIMYEIPSDLTIRKVIITPECARGRREPLIPSAGPGELPERAGNKAISQGG